MTFEFLGNEKLLETLAAWTEGGRFPHALLVEGPKGSGKTYFSHYVGKTILCEAPNPPCNGCSSCMKMDKKIHPDFHLLQGQGGARSFHVDQIRELRGEAWTMPNDGEHKVFLLRRCEEMSLQAQNALLKTLEEPPKGVYFILTCENREALLPTIRSRSTLVSLQLPEKSQSIRYLTKAYPDISPQLVEQAVIAGGGSIGLGMEFLLDDAEEISFPQRAGELWRFLKEGKQLEALGITGIYERDKEGFGKLLESLKKEVTRELLQIKKSGDFRLSNLQLGGIVDIIEEIDNALKGNSNMLLLVTLLPGKIGEILAQ